MSVRSKAEIRHFLHLYMTNGRLLGNAYRDTFSKGDWKRSSLYVAGSRLFSAPTTKRIYKGIMDRKIKSSGEVLAKLSEHADATEKDVSLRALRMLGEYHKLFTQKVESSSPELYQKIIEELAPDVQKWETQLHDSDSTSGNGSAKSDTNHTASSVSSTNPPPASKPSSEGQEWENLSPLPRKPNSTQ